MGITTTDGPLLATQCPSRVSRRRVLKVPITPVVSVRLDLGNTTFTVLGTYELLPSFIRQVLNRKSRTRSLDPGGGGEVVGYQVVRSLPIYGSNRVVTEPPKEKIFYIRINSTRGIVWILSTVSV